LEGACGSCARYVCMCCVWRVYRVLCCWQ
jgi:hypothetical protein